MMYYFFVLGGICWKTDLEVLMSVQPSEREVELSYLNYEELELQLIPRFVTDSLLHGKSEVPNGRAVFRKKLHTDYDTECTITKTRNRESVTQESNYFLPQSKQQISHFPMYLKDEWKKGLTDWEQGTLDNLGTVECKDM